MVSGSVADQANFLDKNKTVRIWLSAVVNFLPGYYFTTRRQTASHLSKIFYGKHIMHAVHVCLNIAMSN